MLFRVGVTRLPRLTHLPPQVLRHTRVPFRPFHGLEHGLRDAFQHTVWLGHAAYPTDKVRQFFGRGLHHGLVLTCKQLERERSVFEQGTAR